MAQQRGHLASHRGRGVDRHAGVLTAGTHDPQLRDGPWLETLVVQELGVRERIPCVGVHRVQRSLTGRQVVGMTGEDEFQVPLGRLGQHPLGPDLADDAADVTPQLAARHDHAVRVPEEPHVADAHDGRGGALLVLAQRRHLGSCHGAVRASGLAGGGDAVGDLQSGRSERGNRPGRAEVDVVGMGGDDEDPAHPVARRPDRYRSALAQRTLSSGRGVQAARSANRGSLENISTMGMRSPSRR